MEPKNENAALGSLQFVLRTIRPLCGESRTSRPPWGELGTRQGQTGNEPAV